MIWTKQQILEKLEKANDDELWILDKKETKIWKTRQQEKTYYKILNAIANHLGYNIQEVKIYILSWCFGTHPLKLSKEYMEIPNISKTSELTKEQGIFFIDTLLQFVKIKDVPVVITSREVQNLYETYN